MIDFNPIPMRRLDEDIALRTLMEGTAKETGERFFNALVENLSRALNTYGAWVTEYLEDRRRLRALSFLIGGEYLKDFEYDIAGTPCEVAIERRGLFHVPDRVMELFPIDGDLKAAAVVSYMGVPLLDMDGRCLGHMGVMDRVPMPEEPRSVALFQIFAARAAAELQRLRAEREVREREEKLRGLIEGAMDAIVELDPEMRVILMNQAAEKVFRCAFGDVIGKSFARLLAAEGKKKLTTLMEELDARPEGQRSLWIPGGLLAAAATGETFPAEATLSRTDMGRERFYTLILRNVNDRVEAERRILSLTAQAEYLKEELKELHNFDEIIGQSEPMLRVLRDVKQVAETDATVLILGETGTGKELFARAIHAESPRREKPLIRVNCAAIPATLMESEFFGHERGAFTGATQRREGRFALADGGSIFLDEIGELPLDLQVKLLRVLQEGEFEPVGSSTTKKVNVRVIAATNRDLHQAVRAKEFREDLYYRLEVFPIHVPPLREREDDLVRLAAAFAARFAKNLGRRVEALSTQDIARLKAYQWPGNVRELENVMERAVITSQNGRVNLVRALPDAAVPQAVSDHVPANAAPTVRTMEELQQLERENLIRALEISEWRVSGEGGAAQRLGMKPSTLTSRMKALSIRRPD